MARGGLNVAEKITNSVLVEAAICLAIRRKLEGCLRLVNQGQMTQKRDRERATKNDNLRTQRIDQTK